MSRKFPVEERLKSKVQINALFNKGSTVSCHPLKLFFLKENAFPVRAKVAFAVPKKTFKKAVDRNRVKRLLRESYRLNKAGYFNNIEGNFAFLILYLGNEIPEFTSLQESMNALFLKFKDRTK